MGALLSSDTAAAGFLLCSSGLLWPQRQHTASDRQWFERYPARIVRFRPERRADFETLDIHGLEPPAFIPEGLDPTSPLTWVAVVDVLRAIGVPCSSRHGAIRARIRTVPIRGRVLQAAMAEVFAIAVCQDVLLQIQAGTESQGLVA